MAALNEYLQIPVFYNGAYLEQITSVTLRGENGIQRVELLNEGLGGFSPGSGTTTIEIGFSIPITGQEQDFWDDMESEALVDMQMGVGPKSYAGRGKLENVEISRSTGQAVEGTFNWTGPLKGLV